MAEEVPEVLNSVVGVEYVKRMMLDRRGLAVIGDYFS